MRNHILKTVEWVIIEPNEHIPLKLKCLRCNGTLDVYGINGHGIPIDALGFLCRGFQEIHRDCKTS